MFNCNYWLSSVFWANRGMYKNSIWHKILRFATLLHFIFITTLRIGSTWSHDLTLFDSQHSKTKWTNTNLYLLVCQSCFPRHFICQLFLVLTPYFSQVTAKICACCLQATMQHWISNKILPLLLKLVCYNLEQCTKIMTPTITRATAISCGFVMVHYSV